ncbi:peroxisomal leader peptide-processing protease [Sceloporus undulatus]|uniref:peroxisomal leader peptide-processing protease n=1 Tax=Sceloporus undulatus TaxID=8520 RepID=UPI001C4D1C8C|nr:peroxisomal leader peptide-processing protease [Sceloporus undulatus]XP_042316940.1 peroxisomal leader peptide-processing protease [Sceloporus undulatus]XP_042316941.1 peroxisomal leader peptide-processing protease [Sceloporus undulatus]
MAESLRLIAGKSGCVVTVSRSPDSSEAVGALSEGPWSSSGVLLAPDPGIVLCHGSIFSPFLLEPEHLDVSQCKVLLPESFSTDLRIQVLGTEEGSSQTPCRSWLGGDLGDNIPVLRFNPLSSLQKTPNGLKHREAQLVLMAPCLQFQEAFAKIFTASDQWHFGGNEVGQESGSAVDDMRFLHWFALLRILDSHLPGAGWLSCAPAKWLRKGDPVITCGSPFGAFCPDIFMNTLSKGIVSNFAGEGNALILTDARCLPGTEGGGIFAISKAGFHLVGIIVAPLCWKANEWVGLTLVCAVDCILENIGSILSGPPWFCQNWLRPMALAAKPRDGLIAKDGLVQQMLATVVLVECGPTWGSGVMVTSRLVLTCRHVVSGASSVCVRLQPHLGKVSVAKGKVVFATKDSSPYDVALVELEESLSTFAEPVLASEFCPGEEVSVVGFGVFGQACSPSVTSGILSAVITVEDKPVMLQATCAVHGGSSGGALFARRSGKLLGIVASNTRDNSIGVTYPHLNFSIPITVLKPAILEFIHNRSLRAFKELDRVGDRIQVVWRLQREPEEIPLSKL